MSKKNAAASAKVKGVKVSVQAVNLPGENNPNPPARAMRKYSKPACKRVAEMLVYALTSGEEPSWWEFAAVLFARLSRTERVSLAYFALMALDEQDAHDTAQVFAAPS